MLDEKSFDAGASIRYYPAVPHDVDNLTEYTREIIVGIAGDVKLRGLDDTDVTLKLPVGRHALVAKRIWATGTTAQNITVVV